MNKKFLVVVDMQKDFITGPLGNPECVNVVDNVVNLIENGNYDTIYVTFDTHDNNYLETHEGKNLPVPHCIEGTDGHKLNERVQNAMKSAYKNKIPINVINKDTFGSIYMANRLTNEENVSSIYKTSMQIDFCGVCTGICVISNAIIVKAALPEANIRVIANACACVTPESHKIALEAMKMCQIEIVE